VLGRVGSIFIKVIIAIIIFAILIFRTLPVLLSGLGS